MPADTTLDSPLAGVKHSTWRFDGFVVAIAVDAGSRSAAFALGSGRARLVDFAKQQAHAARVASLHEGACLALVADGDGFVSGGDDGRVVRLARDGVTAELARFSGQWVEHLAALGDGRVAAAAGRGVHLVGGAPSRALGPHGSTVAGVTVAQAKVWVAHYGGLSIWDPDGDAAPDKLDWKGSHLAVAVSPDGRFVATATQDQALHAWRLANRTEMQMGGYAAKALSLSWSPDSLMLAASGAPTLSAWPFDGEGPEGRAPLELLDGKGALATRVAFHPARPLLAGGFSDGMLAVVDGPRRRAIRVPMAKGSPVSALAWSPDGQHLAAGSEDGRAAILSFPGLRP